MKKKKLLFFFVLAAVCIVCITTSKSKIDNVEKSIDNYSSDNISALSDEQEVTLTVTPKPVIDIVLAKSKTDTDLSRFKEDLQVELERIGVNKNLVSIVNISAIETQQLSYDVSSSDASTIYNTWDQYPNPNNYLLYGEYICNLYGRTGTPQFQSSGTNAFSQLFIKADTYEAGDLEFNFGIKLHGCGFGSGAVIHYNKEADVAYLVVCSNSSNTIQLRYISNFSSYVSRNEAPENFGTLLTSAPYSQWKTSTNAGLDVTSGYIPVSIKMEKNNIKISISGTQYISYDIPSANYIEKGAVGLFAGCCVSFSDVSTSVKVEKIRRLSEILREPEWNDGSVRVVIAAEDIKDAELSDPSTAAELATRLITDNINIVPWGKPVNEQQFKDLIVANNNNGLYVDNQTYNTSIEQTAAYIKTLVEKLPVNNQYILLNEPIGLSFEPAGVENNTIDEDWPYGKWKVEHDYTYYENDLGQFADSGKYLDDFVNVFNKTGRYVITYRDLPINPTEIFVHRKPIAQIDMQVNGTNVALSSESYDLDEYSKENHGISEEEWKWKVEEDSTWHTGKLTTIDPTKSYIVQLRVKDNQETWSDTVSKYITQSDTAIPVAMFNVVTNPVTVYMDNIQINDMSYDPTGKELVTYLWEVYQDGTKIYSGSTPKTDFTDVTKGKYNIYLTVTNSAGKTSERFGRTIEVIDDTIAPEFVINPVSADWTNESVTVNATFTDEGGSGFKAYQYAITNSQAVPDSYGAEIESSTAAIEITENGENYLHIIAKDNAGNISENRVVGPYKIDKELPDLTLSYEQPTEAIRGAKVTIVGTDNVSGVAKVVFPNGTQTNVAETTYIVTDPGTYTFKVVDKAGNETTKDINVEIVSDGVDVKYVDIGNSNEEIATKVTLSGKVGENYTTEAKEIEGYELVKIPENATGILTIDKQTVVYEYKLNSNVTTKYIDQVTGNEIHDEKVEIYKQDDVYSTSAEEIEGYELVKTPTNKDGIVQREDIIVTYEYRKTTEGVEIQYVDQVTGTKIASSIVKNGVEGTEYTSEAKEIEGYELVKTPDNANGEMTVEKIIVKYEYRLVSYVTVNYEDEITRTHLKEPISTKYLEGQEYTSTQESFDGYTFSKVEGTPNGTMGRANIVITYYYKKNANVIVKYVDMLDGDSSIVADKTINGVEGQEYTTEPIDIDGYEYIRSVGNTSGNMTIEPITVIYKYKKLATLTTTHIDIDNGEEIHDPVVITYKEGDTYEALPQNIAGYVKVEDPEEKTGVMGRENIIRTYKYKRVSDGLVVKYVDVKTNDVLDTKVYTGKVGDVIKLERKSFMYYLLYSKPDYDSVKLTQSHQEVIYYYVRSIKMDVIGIDEETGKELFHTKIEGPEGDPYDEKDMKDLNGYELVEMPANAKGNFNRNDTEIKFVYRRLENKVDASVLVKHIDIDTKEELHTETITGFVGDSYITARKEFAGYGFVKVEGQAKGEMTEEQQVVTYYYSKKSSKVVVTYEDEKGNVIDSEELVGKVGESYEVKVKEIDGYEVVKLPENVKGEFTEEIIEIKVKLQKIHVAPAEKGTIIIKFVDEDGNEIRESAVTTGNEGDTFNLTLPKIDGYEIVGDKVINTKYQKGELVIEAKYKKIENEKPDPEKPGPEKPDPEKPTPEEPSVEPKPEEEAPNTGDINVVLITSIMFVSIVILVKKGIKLNNN